MRRIICLGLLCCLFFVSSCSKKAEDKVSNDVKSSRVSISKEQLFVRSMLGQPGFSGDFLYHLTGSRANIVGVNVTSNDVYFALDSEYVSSNDDLTELAIHPDGVKFGKNKSGEFILDKNSTTSLILGDYSYSYFDKYFFKIHISNLKYDSEKILSYQIGQVVYEVSLKELAAYANNQQIYGGKLTVQAFVSGNFVVGFNNHGAFIAKNGEPSLSRLVNALVGEGGSYEAKVQKLLDFVTCEIKYSDAEANYSVDTLKRPSEILLTGESDCSGKVILFASLLEQIGADYKILYVGEGGVNHITVIVAGNFSLANKLSLKFGDKRYFLAETTTKNFVIGRTRLQKDLFVGDIFVQVPGKDSLVYNAKTGKELKFL